MIYPSSNLSLKCGGGFALSLLASSTCYTTTFRAERRLGTLREATCVQGCTDLFPSSAPRELSPCSLSSLPLALQGAWSANQLLETSAQACHESEDSWILERKATHVGVYVCVPAM